MIEEILKHNWRKSPVINFINKYEGKIVGTLIDSVMLEDGKLHDDVMFKLFKKDYIERKN